MHKCSDVAHVRIQGVLWLCLATNTALSRVERPVHGRRECAGAKPPHAPWRVRAANMVHDATCANATSAAAATVMTAGAIFRHAADVDVPSEARRAMVATLQLHDLDAVARRLWDAAAVACTPEAQIQALDALRAACFSAEYAGAVVACGAETGALARLVTAPPTRMTGLPPWLALTALLQAGHPTGALSPQQLYELLTAVVPASVSVLARWTPGTNRTPSPEDLASEVRRAWSVSWQRRSVLAKGCKEVLSATAWKRHDRCCGRK